MRERVEYKSSGIRFSLDDWKKLEVVREHLSSQLKERGLPDKMARLSNTETMVILITKKYQEITETE